MNQTSLFASFAILFIVSACVSTSIAQTNDLKIEPHTFVNSKNDKIEAEFGRLTVPENRSKKDSRTIEVAFVRFKSTSPNPGPPIVYLAGGPGGSGIESARHSRFDLFMSLRKFGDVIAYEQRGTGRSTPNLRCDSKLDLPLEVPLTREAYAAENLKKVKECYDAWTAKDVDVSAYNTVENANDINDLRIALGARKIRLWGISYGTHLGLATIRQHGTYIDSAILAGVEAMDDTLKLPRNTDLLIDELSRRAAIDPSVSEKIPSLRDLLKNLLDSLYKTPVRIEVKDPKTKENHAMTIGKFDVQLIIAAASGDADAQTLFPKLFLGMEKGEFGFLKQFLYGFRKGNTPSLMSIAMDCASGVSEKRRKMIGVQAGNSILADAINSPFPEICKELNIKDLGDSFRKPVKSKVPVLFISGSLDGRTPVSNATDAALGFKSHSHLIIDGAAHSDPLFLSTPKIEEYISQFLAGKKLPDVIEVAMEKPFKFAAP